MDIQNNVFAVVSAVVKVVSDAENTNRIMITIRERMEKLESDIKRYDAVGDAYMKCIKTIETSGINKDSPIYCELLNAWKEGQENKQYAGQDFYEAGMALNNWRESVIKKTVVDMGITEPNIKNMFVELAIKQMTSK